MRRNSARRAAGNLGLVLVAGLLVAGGAGCSPDVSDVLVDASGQEIRITAITAITQDPGLDEAAQRQALRDLGITDEDLIDLLVREL
jgi:hypothetical protein